MDVTLFLLISFSQLSILKNFKLTEKKKCKSAVILMRTTFGWNKIKCWISQSALFLLLPPSYLHVFLLGERLWIRLKAPSHLGSTPLESKWMLEHVTHLASSGPGCLSTRLWAVAGNVGPHSALCRCPGSGLADSPPPVLGKCGLAGAIPEAPPNTALPEPSTGLRPAFCSSSIYLLTYCFFWVTRV